ncbi:MAG: hypothetical protein K2P94_19190 [Rhodospirillaceae bacterium]|nr:hypothetical protein [Rhodospirillaceae bacterium]
MTLRPSVARALALILPVTALLVVAGCSSKPIPPCPNVRVDSATSTLTKFKDGPGRDVTDIEYQAEITGYNGQCVHHEDEVDVTFDVDFAVTGGPAAKGGTAPLYYFVAIPQFFPEPTGKRIIDTQAKLPDQANARTRFQETGVRVTIPLKKDQPAAGFDVYVGFQLDNAQLDFNRSRMQK